MSSALCIAVVDDEAPVRTALRRLLRLADYEVVGFESGEAFLTSLATRVPACAVLDVHMPGLSGFDVHLRLRAAHGDVPVVFITASDDPTLDQIARERHGSTLLRKPFSRKELLDAVSSALSSKSSDTS